MANTRQHRVAILLCPGFSHFSLPAVTEPLFIANWLLGEALFVWQTYSVDGLAVSTSSGASVPANAPLGARDEADTVVVLASFESRAVAKDDRVLNWLRRMAATSSRIGGIETASEILATAGLLDRRHVAVHWYNVEGFQERFPGVLAEAARFRRDGRFLSSAGATATIDLMLAVIAEAASDTVASEVARHLMVNLGDPTRPLPIPLASEGPDDPLVRRALALINDRLDESRNCAALARDLGVSLRQLQRRVQTAQGRSLGREWQEAQFARAHQLVQQTDLSLTEIAIAVGYGSLEAFSRAYRKRFGISPSRDREQTTRTSVFRPPVLGVR